MGLNFYKRYPGDYMRDTADLTLAQHGAYTLMLDHYYSTGEPLPKEGLYRICRAFEEDERKAVDFILSKFFTLTSSGYVSKRAEKELKSAADRAAIARENGKKGGRPKTNNETKTEPTGLAKINQKETQSESLPDTRSQTSEARLQKPDNKPLSADTDVVEIFNYWKQVMGKQGNTLLSQKRKKKIEARLKEYPIDEIKRAIDNCKLSPHHQGQNDQGTVYDDIELICRNPENIERFRDMQTKQKNGRQDFSQIDYGESGLL